MTLTPRRAVFAVVVLGAVACVFAVYLRLFSREQLLGETFAAVLGVIITAVITMILLKGQSNDDVERERAAKIFEEKLRIYDEFLRTLCDVIRDNALSDEEKVRLEFQTSYVAMHCDPKYIEAASAAVKELIEHACPDEEKKELAAARASDSPEPLLDSLFCIVEAFRKDLYGDSFKFDDVHKRRTLDNFSSAYRDAKESDGRDEKKEQRIAVDLNVLSGSLPGAGAPEGKSEEEPIEPQADVPRAEDTELWDAAVLRWKEEGWNAVGLSSEYDSFKLKNAGGNPAVIYVGFYGGCYNVQARYEGDTDFSKPLKWENGGRRSYGTWWQELEAPYGRMPQGKFVEEFKRNRDFQQYIINFTERLKDISNLYHRTATWKKAVGSHKNWNIFIWYWGTLACQLSLDEEGTPYMDIVEQEAGNFAIFLSNRKKDVELLNKTLRRIGCQEKEIKDCGVCLEDVDGNAVPERVRHWIEKIGPG